MHSGAKGQERNDAPHGHAVAAGDGRQFEFDPHVGIRPRRSGRVGWFGAEELPVEYQLSVAALGGLNCLGVFNRPAQNGSLQDDFDWTTAGPCLMDRDGDVGLVAFDKAQRQPEFGGQFLLATSDRLVSPTSVSAVIPVARTSQVVSASAPRA